MHARNGRDRRAWKGRFFLRDVAGFAAIERLLDVGVERLYPDVIDPAPPTSSPPAKTKVVSAIVSKNKRYVGFAIERKTPPGEKGRA